MKIIMIYKDEYNREPEEIIGSDDTKILRLVNFEEFKEIVIALEKGAPNIDLDMIKKEKENESN